jgi:hypothetical protein
MDQFVADGLAEVGSATASEIELDLNVGEEPMRVSVDVAESLLQVAGVFDHFHIDLPMR